MNADLRNCVFCVYERADLAPNHVRAAVVQATTPRGVRALCEQHAKSGTWGRPLVLEQRKGAILW